MEELTLGKDKTPISQLSDRDLSYWSGRISKNLEENPNSKYAGSNRRKLEAVRAEQGKRQQGGNTTQHQPSTALAKAPQQKPAAFSLDKVVHDPTAASHRLKELSEQGHLISPATMVDALPPGFGVAVSMVRVDPDDRKDGPGDVTGISGRLMLSAGSLKRIGAAAGVDWDPLRSGRLDNRAHPHYCHYRAVGLVRNFDGSVRTITGEVEIDARDGGVDEQEIREKARRRKEEHPDWDNDGGDKQLLELRKFILRHTETKAKNRAIVDMGCKRSYKPKELEVPFFVARLMWTGQTDDPELKREFARIGAEKMLGSTAAAYGAQATAALPPQAPQAALPQFTGHDPPPVGQRAADDDEDYTTYDVEGYGEEAPVHKPSAPQDTTPAPEQQQGLPSDQDRGPDPNDY